MGKTCEVNILCTGISCSGRNDLLYELAGAAGGAKDASRSGRPSRSREAALAVHNVGDHMLAAARRAGVQFTDKVLDSDPAVLTLCRSLALKDIAKRMSEHDVEKRSSVLSVHACFRWRGILVEGLTHADIEEFPADVFINVVDDVEAIYRRSLTNPQWAHLTRDELNVWLDEEEFLTRLFAAYAGKPYFAVARSHPVDNLRDLFFSDKKKCYLSYPITLLRDNPGQVDRIREFGQRLSERFVVFDPLYIKDMDSVRRSEEPAEDAETVDRIDRVCMERVRTRTVTRDYQFIRQSDLVIVVYPTDRLSPGVLSEMNFAHRHNKTVYAVYDHARSPFFELLCDYIFRTSEELESFLQ